MRQRYVVVRDEQDSSRSHRMLLRMIENSIFRVNDEAGRRRDRYSKARRVSETALIVICLRYKHQQCLTDLRSN